MNTSLVSSEAGNLYQNLNALLSVWKRAKSGSPKYFTEIALAMSPWTIYYLTSNGNNTKEIFTFWVGYTAVTKHSACWIQVVDTAAKPLALYWLQVAGTAEKHNTKTCNCKRGFLNPPPPKRTTPFTSSNCLLRSVYTEQLDNFTHFTTQQLFYVPPGLTFTNSTFCPHSVFMRFVCIWEKRAII